jgi:hypothetical protein
MALEGNLIEEADAIHCGAVNVDVVISDWGGNQIMSSIGRVLSIDRNVVTSAPEDCPLTMPGGLRELGDFATCLECRYGSLVADTDG